MPNDENLFNSFDEIHKKYSKAFTSREKQKLKEKELKEKGLMVDSLENKEVEDINEQNEDEINDLFDSTLDSDFDSLVDGNYNNSLSDTSLSDSEKKSIEEEESLDSSSSDNSNLDSPISTDSDQKDFDAVPSAVTASDKIKMSKPFQEIIDALDAQIESIGDRGGQLDKGSYLIMIKDRLEKLNFDRKEDIDDLLRYMWNKDTIKVLNTFQLYAPNQRWKTPFLFFGAMFKSTTNSYKLIETITTFVRDNALPTERMREPVRLHTQQLR